MWHLCENSQILTTRNTRHYTRNTGRRASTFGLSLATSTARRSLAPRQKSRPLCARSTDARSLCSPRSRSRVRARTPSSTTCARTPRSATPRLAPWPTSPGTSRSSWLTARATSSATTLLPWTPMSSSLSSKNSSRSDEMT